MTKILAPANQQAVEWRAACLSLGLAAVMLAPLASASSDTEAPVKKASIIVPSTCSKPVWPEEALRNKDQGTVHLGFLIGVDGRVKKSAILKSSGYPSLDEAAREGLSKCRFKPGTYRGNPVEARLMMQYVWTLD